MDRTETRIDRELLDALRALAAEEGRDEYEVVDDAARLYLKRRSAAPRLSISESLESARERRERLGIAELSEKEALRIAVEEQHAHRRGE